MGCSTPNSMGSPRSTSRKAPPGLQCPAEDQSAMEWLRYLPKILKSLVGRSPTTSIVLRIFVEQANKVTLLPWECLSSYDVTALFTSLPVEPALGIIKDLLEQDNILKERIVVLVKDIILMLEFCLKSTSLSRVKFMKQVEDRAMGSPISPIAANLYMEYIEQKALSTATPPLECESGIWNTTFVIQKEDHKQNFLEHIYSVDLAIRFTAEDNKKMVPSPSWIPLSSQKPMVDCLSQYIVNPPTWISICNGIVTIT